MFNIGGGEFLVIALIALIVLGPQRLPDAARQVGKAMGELRRLSNGFQNEIKDAFADSESSATPAPRRDVLRAAPEPPTSTTRAVGSVSSQAPARRTPLRAAPLPDTDGAASTPTARTTAGSAKKATAPRKSARPRSKGS